MDRLREWSSRGYLPHYNAASTCQLVTFRLADALPKQVNAKLLELAGSDLEARKKVEQYLDEGHGSVILNRRENAEVVENALLHFHEVRYKLHAWVVMPNHVHALLEPQRQYSVGEIVRSWKGFTAFKIARNETNGIARNARVWQPDYFDRYIRDERHYLAARSYIAENPVKAGIARAAEQWKWSSAYLK